MSEIDLPYRAEQREAAFSALVLELRKHDLVADQAFMHALRVYVVAVAAYNQLDAMEIAIEFYDEAADGVHNYGEVNPGFTTTPSPTT